MTSYPIEVYWSAEDGAWIADVPDLPYCTAHTALPTDRHLMRLWRKSKMWLRRGWRRLPQPGVPFLSPRCARHAPEAG